MAGKDRTLRVGPVGEAKERYSNVPQAELILINEKKDCMSMSESHIYVT